MPSEKLESMRPTAMTTTPDHLHLEIDTSADETSGASCASIVDRDLGRYEWLLEGALDTLGLNETQAADLVMALFELSLARVWSAASLCRLLETVLLKRASEGYPDLALGLLVQHVKGWSDLQVIAAVDAVERFWIRVGETDEDPDVCLRKVRLIIDDGWADHFDDDVEGFDDDVEGFDDDVEDAEAAAE